MRYVEFGNTGKKISCLGFGAMRLPVTDDSKDPWSKNVDENKAVAMLRYAFDNGVNYVDTAYVYHGGVSEVIVGKALKDGYREKVYLADKLPTWMVKTLKDADKYLNEQLQRLDTDYIDFYLLHCLNAQEWQKVKKLKLLEWCEAKKRQGLIKHIGFSFHDSCAVFKEIIEGYDWEFCQVQHNYLNETVQAGTAGVEFAYSHNIPVIIMEPLLGGRLAKMRAVAKQFKAVRRTAVEMALRWLWNKKEINVVLSGMSEIQQVIDNIEYAERSGVGTLSEKEADAVISAQAEMKKLNMVPCTACRYCVDCPKRIDIPEIFSLYNSGNNPMLGKRAGEARDSYNELQHLASECIACRNCERHCPQQISIVEKLKEAHAFLYREPKKKK